MERNDGNNPDATGQSGASEFPGNGSPQQGGGFDFSGTAGTTEPQQGLRDKAKEAVGSAGERLSGVGSTVRERAGNVKNRLADALESGAEKLRHPRGTDDLALAGATAEGTTTAQGDTRIAQVTDRVAGGMQASAEWLRDAELDSLKATVEQQVKEHPGRTLLIAAGLGYLIGRAFKSNQ